MSSGTAGKVVCVTGASGYIASWIVKLLLARGYIVKATVRDPNDPKKTEHLHALDGASERLQLFKANLLEEGSFDSVVDGCADDKPSVPTYQVSREKAKNLGIDFIPFECSLKETVESLKEKGFIDF
ncbi:hypothetical protein JRO89_XS10G0057000 [Xanthoceras sorbifolium]|uniref:NmrA-like domain-containing protein n=1 Tax=Xanthoceras sorbifolium TaxID=99658 RepID=A0ABQ8HHT2_9ROSI|nr:hypothetical protein JRO89_XS10G0057000 [Xanthoceras sorbifolium]